LDGVTDLHVRSSPRIIDAIDLAKLAKSQVILRYYFIRFEKSAN
jgi:hypothetical protein